MPFFTACVGVNRSPLSSKTNPVSRLGYFASAPVARSIRFSARTVWTLIPKGLVDHCLMLSWICVTLVRDLAAIDAVLKHEIEGAAGELVTAINRAVREDAAFAADSGSYRVLP